MTCIIKIYALKIFFKCKQRECTLSSHVWTSIKMSKDKYKYSSSFSVCSKIITKLPTIIIKNHDCMIRYKQTRRRVFGLR